MHQLSVYHHWTLRATLIDLDCIFGWKAFHLLSLTLK